MKKSSVTPIGLITKETTEVSLCQLPHTEHGKRSSKLIIPTTTIIIFKMIPKHRNALWNAIIITLQTYLLSSQAWKPSAPGDLFPASKMEALSFFE